MSLFNYERVRSFFEQADRVIKRIEAQQNLEERLRSIDAACVQNKQLLQDPNSRAEVEQQKIAIESENRRLLQLEKNQIKFMRKWMADFSFWLADVKTQRNIDPDMLTGVRAAVVCLEQMDLFSDLKDIEYMRNIDSALRSLVTLGINNGWLDCDPYEKDLQEIAAVRDIFKKITTTVFEFEKEMSLRDPEISPVAIENPTKTHEELVKLSKSFDSNIELLFKEVPNHLFESENGINDLLMDLLRLNITKEVDLDLDSVAKVFSRSSDYWDQIKKKVEDLDLRLSRLSIAYEKEKHFVNEAFKHLEQDNYQSANEILDSLSKHFPSLPIAELENRIKNTRDKAHSPRQELRLFLKENNPKWVIPEDRDRNLTSYPKYAKSIASRIINPTQVPIAKKRWKQRLEEFIEEITEQEENARNLKASQTKETLLKSCRQVIQEAQKLDSEISQALDKRKLKTLFIGSFSILFIILAAAIITLNLLIPHTGFEFEGRGITFENVSILDENGTPLKDITVEDNPDTTKSKVRNLLPGDYVLKFEKSGNYPYYLKTSASIGSIINITNELLEAISQSNQSTLSLEIPPATTLRITNQNGWTSSLTTKITELKATSSVQSSTFIPQKNHLIVGYLNGSIRIYDLDREIMLREFQEHSESVESLAIDTTGRYLVSGSVDKTMKVWDLLSDSLLKSLNGHQGTIHDIAFKPNDLIVATACADGKVRIWDLMKDRVIKELETSRADDLAAYDWGVVPQFKSDHTARDIIGMMAGNNLSRSNTGVHSVQFTNDGARLISGKSDGTLSIWNLFVESYYEDEMSQMQKELQKIQKAKQEAEKQIIEDVKAYEALEEDVLDMVSELKQKVNSEKLLSNHGGKGKEVELLESIAQLKLKVERMKRNVHIPAHKSSIYKIKTSPDGRYILTAGSDGIVKVWDYNQRQLIHNLIGHETPVVDVAWFNDHILSASSDGQYIRWAINDGSIIDKTQAHKHAIRSLSVSEVEGIFTTGSIDTTVKIWKPYEKSILRMPAGNYKIEFIKEGYTAKVEEISLQANEVKNLSPKLSH